MSIAKIKLDESTKLEFGVSITGAEGKPEARFIVEGPQYTVGFPCHAMSGGGIEVELGNFKNLFPAGEYPVRLEVVIENKIFTPFTDTIVLEPNVEITSKPKAVKEIKESIKVDQVVVKPMVNEQTKKQFKLAGLIAEALEVTPTKGLTPAQIIDEALLNRCDVTRQKATLVNQMLSAAKAEGVEFSNNLLSRNSK